MSEEAVLTVQNLIKNYPGHTKAIDGISFSIRSGECVGLIGESGSGKSTLARCILMMEKMESGQIWFQGREMLQPRTASAYRALQGQVQAVFQNPASSLNPRLRIIDSLMEPLDTLKHRTPVIVQDCRQDRLKCAKRLLNMVELPEHLLHQYPHELSGGQKQRVAIARAISSEPSLIIMDEPTSSLDMITQAQIIEMLMTLQKNIGFACLFISHDLATIQRISDRIMVIQQGRIIDHFAKEALYTFERHAYTQQLVHKYRS
ncbi:ABC transporter ATP-binding protein [Paenibacillus sp. OK003]|uniref:ABC transporter ATP-binding protein n=1 Tax=Paenibacillus sp. OK003 TaxID=1884380 RepID=UPI0008B4B21A|nr:dipeptide/oligopeptide/nickel ABC transporter ATP-binding protein [Paenibacillus sp. OK003]SEK58541.1 peptide/nickel transport system ATP-binding protein [Paenibacillus sp. OK003]